MCEVILIASIHELNTGGGQHLYRLATGINKSLMLNVVVTAEGDLSKALAESGVCVTVIADKGKFDVLWVLKVIRFVFMVKKKNTIIHTHTERTSFNINILCKILGFKLVTTVHRSLLRGSPWAGSYKESLYLFLENIIYG